MSVLGEVSVDRRSRVSPGSQLERQLAVMVREGRLAAGRRLPSTRRVADRVGVHRNTVAAAYRRLAARGLLEVRHGARARVAEFGAGARSPGASGALGPSAVEGGGGSGRRLLAAAADEGTARVMAAELSSALGGRRPVEPVVTASGDGAEPSRRGCLAVALPGAAARWASGAGPDRWLLGRQDPRAGVRAAVRRLPPLAVVALASGSRALREAVRVDLARVRGGEVAVRAAGASRRGVEPGGAGSPDLVIADRLAAGALCDSAPGARASTGGTAAGDSAPCTESVRARLLAPATVDEVRRRLDGGPTRAMAREP